MLKKHGLWKLETTVLSLEVISEFEKRLLQLIPSILFRDASHLGIRSTKVFMTRTLVQTLTLFLHLIVTPTWKVYLRLRLERG